MASCFDPTYSTGWCATCDPEAKRGQRGYCGPGETNTEEEAPIIYPNSTNWGFCDENCGSRNGDENMLQASVHFISIICISKVADYDTPTKTHFMSGQKSELLKLLFLA